MGASFCPLVARKGLHSGGGCMCVGSGGDSLDTAPGGGNVIRGWEELQLLVQGLKVGQYLSPNFPPVPPNSGISAPFTSLEFGPLPPLADSGQHLGLQVGEWSIHLRPAVCVFMGTRNGPKVPDMRRWVCICSSSRSKGAETRKVEVVHEGPRILRCTPTSSGV